MNKFVNISQLILSCIMLFAVVVSIVAHIILGNIASFIGYLVSAGIHLSHMETGTYIMDGVSK